MEFTKEREIDGVMQRDFSVHVEGESVPCVIYSPKDAKGPRVLIVTGHGGSQHKKTVTTRRRAIRYANEMGWATVVADAPGHGDRISREEAMKQMEEVGKRVRGEVTLPPPSGDNRLKLLSERAGKVVDEWKAMLDAAQQLDFIGDEMPVGYWGVSMGTMFGVPFVAAEPRIKCAVFGLAGMREGTGMEEAARKISIPVEFVFQWDDAVAPRKAGIALFNAFASAEKTMHINPGGHLDIPEFENESWLAFYRRHLTK
jgi:cephalosporin-C deacetylase-like acetyl esterase